MFSLAPAACVAAPANASDGLDPAWIMTSTWAAADKRKAPRWRR